MDYLFCLFAPLAVVYAAAVALLVLAFVPKFSVATFGNALLLTTVCVPLYIDRLSPVRRSASCSGSATACSSSFS